MTNWTFYPIFIATLVSITGLTIIAARGHDKERPRTLSELAAAEQELFEHFRYVLLFCGALFAITVFGFIVPGVSHPILVVVFGTLMIGGEMLAAIIPARNKTTTIHNIMAQIMAVGMLGLACAFWASLQRHSIFEGALTLLMCGLAVSTLLDKKRYLIYELGFIFSSHFSILVAAIALR
jgi:hypothetical protein